MNFENRQATLRGSETFFSSAGPFTCLGRKTVDFVILGLTACVGGLTMIGGSRDTASCSCTLFLSTLRGGPRGGNRDAEAGS
jgi:hypothetical protein